MKNFVQKHAILMTVLILVTVMGVAADNLNRVPPWDILASARGPRTSGTLTNLISAWTSRVIRLHLDGEWAITNNVTFTTNFSIKMLPGSKLNVATNMTVDFGESVYDCWNLGFTQFVGEGSVTGDAVFFYRDDGWGDTNQYFIGDPIFNVYTQWAFEYFASTSILTNYATTNWVTNYFRDTGVGRFTNSQTLAVTCGTPYVELEALFNTIGYIDGGVTVTVDFADCTQTYAQAWDFIGHHAGPGILEVIGNETDHTKNTLIFTNTTGPGLLFDNGAQLFNLTGFKLSGDTTSGASHVAVKLDNASAATISGPFETEEWNVGYQVKAGSYLSLSYGIVSNCNLGVDIIQGGQAEVLNSLITDSANRGFRVGGNGYVNCGSSTGAANATAIYALNNGFVYAVGFTTNGNTVNYNPAVNTFNVNDGGYINN